MISKHLQVTDTVANTHTFATNSIIITTLHYNLWHYIHNMDYSREYFTFRSFVSLPFLLILHSSWRSLVSERCSDWLGSSPESLHLRQLHNVWISVMILYWVFNDGVRNVKRQKKSRFYIALSNIVCQQHASDFPNQF